MVKKELLGGLPDLGTGIFPVSPSRRDRTALEGGGAAVEDEDRPGAEEEQLADATKEAENVRVAHHLSLLIPHRLDELHKPYAGICDGNNNSEPLQFLRRLRKIGDDKEIESSWEKR